MGQWQPIETAPRGRTVLLWESKERYYRLGFYAFGEWVVFGREYPGAVFTHWQPLPEPPQAD